MSHGPRIHRSQEPDAPEALLGREHPLARAEERMRWLRRQFAAVALLLAGSAVALGLHAAELRTLLFTAAAAQALLVACLVSTAGTRRERALELIAEGRDTLPIASVRRERARLTDPRRRAALARSLDRLRADARPDGYRRLVRPLFVPAVIRQADAELARLAELLRSSGAGVIAVARTERLLGGASSPLYGEDGMRLREELRRIRIVM
jgi:hypothetical protein